jgi:hypothetical protein
MSQHSITPAGSTYSGPSDQSLLNRCDLLNPLLAAAALDDATTGMADLPPALPPTLPVYCWAKLYCLAGLYNASGKGVWLSLLCHLSSPRWLIKMLLLPALLPLPPLALPPPPPLVPVTGFTSQLLLSAAVCPAEDADEARLLYLAPRANAVHAQIMHAADAAHETPKTPMRMRTSAKVERGTAEVNG